MFTKELEDLKDKQDDKYNNKNKLEGLDRINKTEKWVSELEDRLLEITAMK